MEKSGISPNGVSGWGKREIKLSASSRKESSPEPGLNQRHPVYKTKLATSHRTALHVSLAICFVLCSQDAPMCKAMV